MRNRIRTEIADIDQLPRQITSAEATRESTIGDLHGNAMKLMYMLIREGVITGITEEAYSELVHIYKKPVAELSAEDLNRFNAILDSLQYHKAFIRLIGDEFADRGSNDYFTLMILKKLQEREIPFEVLASNHSLEFLFSQKSGRWHARTLRGNHCRSLENLLHLVSKDLVSLAEISEIVVKAYQPNFKIVSYSLNDDCTEIILYSHAAIDLRTIVDLAKKFEVPYQDESIFALAQTINCINEKFEKICESELTLAPFCPLTSLSDAYRNPEVNLRSEPVVFAMWNRRYDFLKRPNVHQGYKLCYVHGHDRHDPQDPLYDHVLDLDKDNDLGRTDMDRQGRRIEHNSGYPYSVLHSKKSYHTLQELKDLHDSELHERKASPAGGFFESSDVACAQSSESDSPILIMTKQEQSISIQEPEQLSISSLFQTLCKLPGADFAAAFKDLNTEQQILVCKEFKNHLPQLLTDGIDSSGILKCLGAEHRQVIFEVIIGHFPYIITNIQDVIAISLFLNLEQEHVIFRTLKDQLKRFIMSSMDFVDVLKRLNTDQRRIIFEMFKDQLSTRITSGADFNSVLKLLNMEQRKEVYQGLKLRLPHIIKNSADFDEALTYFDMDQRAELHRLFSGKSFSSRFFAPRGGYDDDFISESKAESNFVGY